MPARPLPPLKIEFNDALILRPPVCDDGLKIEKGLKESLPDLKEFMQWSHYPLPSEKQIERIAEQYGRYFLGSEYEFALFEKKSGDFLFYSGIYPVNRINPGCMEIGFWTVSRHRGKGYATLSTKILIAFIFEYLKGDRIEITCSVNNTASLKVIEKCGFKREGELRNFYPLGTSEMRRNAFTKERRVYFFSLIPEDRNSLSWYDSMLSSVVLYPAAGEPYSLQSLHKN